VAAVQPAAEVALGLLDVAVAAERGIARLGDDQSLACIRLCPERGPKQRQGLEQARTERGRAEHGGMGAGISAQFGLLDETPGFIDPGRVENDAGAQKEQPRRARDAAALSRAPRPCADTSTRQPAPSAIAAVASREPASATITSRTMPAAAPETNAASVGNSARSLLCVAITTLSMTDVPQARPTRPLSIAGPARKRTVPL
jgi:hypothetical protein